jgi:hypothetical protein
MGEESLAHGRLLDGEGLAHKREHRRSHRGIGDAFRGKRLETGGEFRQRRTDRPGGGAARSRAADNGGKGNGFAHLGPMLGGRRPACGGLTRLYGTRSC